MTDGRPPGYGPWTVPDRRRRWALGGLATVMLALTVDALWTSLGIATMGGVVEIPGDGWFDAFDRVTAVIGGAYLVALAASAVTFIRWQRLTARNLLFFGHERLEYSPAIASLAWFIPIVSLVLPYLVVSATARASRPPDSRSPAALIGWWWSLWVVANLVLSGSSIGFTVSGSPQGWIAAATADTIGSLILIACGILAMRVVNVISDHQRRMSAWMAGPDGV